MHLRPSPHHKSHLKEKRPGRRLTQYPVTGATESGEESQVLLAPKKKTAAAGGRVFSLDATSGLLATASALAPEMLLALRSALVVCVL